MSDKALPPPMSEEALLAHIAALQALYVEVRSLIMSGYDGQFMGEEVRDLFAAFQQAQKTEKGLR